MAIEMKNNTAWVAEDGSYGFGTVITLGVADLSIRQWGVAESLSDTDRFEYINAIMAGEPTGKWEDAE